VKRENYLMIDHRASPGIPAGRFRAAGFNMPEVPEGKMFEAAVLVCLHCQTHVVQNFDRTRERGYCPKCDGYICDICTLNMRAADYVHRPFKQIVDEVMGAAVKRSDPPLSQTNPNLQLPPLLKGD
jgi:hypothetical protein